MSDLNSEAGIVSNFDNELKHAGLTVRHQQDLPSNFSFKGKKKSRPDLNCDITDHNRIVRNALLLVEVKLNPADHQKCIKQLKGYMNNLLYLEEDTNVIGIALSGSGPTRKLNTFVKLQGGKDIEDVQINKVLPIQNYFTNILDSAETDRASNATAAIITKFAKELGDEIRSRLGIDVSNFSLLISAIMLCVEDPSFKLTYGNQSNMKVLLNNMQGTINNMLSVKNIPASKSQIIMQEYAHIWNSTSLQSKKVSSLIKIIGKVHTWLSKGLNSRNDILGMFYSQFLKYGASNQKNLGIVLTPEHCSEFMVDLAELTVDSKVIDTCCGTGSFLITAMGRMLNMADNNQAKQKHIKSQQIMGIELHNKIFTLACANMILRGDGQSNLENDDCLERSDGSYHKVREHFKHVLKPNRLIINPPYALDDHDEWEFMLQSLDLLEEGGRMVAIVPMSKCIASKRAILDFKERLLTNHSLEAVFSMPDQLFVDVSAVTVVIVVKAHIPHPKTKRTFFGYLKDDGFYTSKSQRIEREDGLWNSIKQEILDAYIGRVDIPELSINKAVTFEDEWCAEAYLECNYKDFNSIEDVAKENVINNIVEAVYNG